MHLAGRLGRIVRLTSAFRHPAAVHLQETRSALNYRPTCHNSSSHNMSARRRWWWCCLTSFIPCWPSLCRPDAAVHERRALIPMHIKRCDMLQRKLPGHHHSIEAEPQVCWACQSVQSESRQPREVTMQGGRCKHTPQKDMTFKCSHHTSFGARIRSVSVPALRPDYRA